MKNLKFEYENFPNESLGQVKHFKHVYGVGVGWEFEKMWIKIKTIRASVDISWFLWKKSVGGGGPYEFLWGIFTVKTILGRAQYLQGHEYRVKVFLAKTSIKTPAPPPFFRFTQFPI